MSVGLLARGERGVGELAAALGEREATVARHLGVLQALGVIEAGAGGGYRLAVEALREMRRAVLGREPVAMPADAPTAGPEERVFRAFFDGERLKSIPADRKKRAVVLDWLAGRFARGVRYPEAEVRMIIKRHHPDSAALRRELVDGGWLAREAGVYWRLPAGE